jgi:hypothetical protein
MRANTVMSRLIKSFLCASAILVASSPASAQQQINLSAGPTTAALPDGSVVPMWGYSCDTLQVSGSLASCAALSPAAATGGWSPVLITVPTGQDLQINLTNNLTFTPVGGGTANTIPTSLVIVGQLGGGLGGGGVYKSSPAHIPQGATWPIVGDTGGSTFNPPAQLGRVESFGTEVTVGTPASLCWGLSCPTPTPALQPGTYLFESGTHPSIQAPMGLYGILVVTTAPTSTTLGNAYGTAGTASAVSYAAELPLLLSEIDPNQNGAVQAAASSAGFSEISARVERDSVSSVTLTVDANGSVVSAGTGYRVGDAVNFALNVCTGQPSAAVSQVDGTGAILAVQMTSAGAGCTTIPAITSVTSALGTNAQLTANLSLAGVMCSDGAAACYPPAVNYAPLYYLVNGAAFDRTHVAASLFNTAPATGVTGNVLVRLVNAGLRMHVPSIVGATTGAASTPGLSLVAEDGNVLPGVSRVQSEVFMAAGKTYDVMVNAPQPSGTTAPAALPIYDRELSLSGNAVNRDSGMLAYISVNGGTTPSTASTVAAAAKDDTYNSLIANAPFAITDPGKGVIANDVNVFGVTVLTTTAHGAVTLARNGTFTYVPYASNTTAASDSFTYCANGYITTTSTCSSGLTATVHLGACGSDATCNIGTPGGILVVNDSFTSTNGFHLAVKPPGILANDSDTANFPLTVFGATNAAPKKLALAGPGSGSVTIDPAGGFDATVSTSGVYTFSYQAQNGQGVVSSNSATVTLTFQAPSNLQVTVLDGVDKTTVISDYRWIIEEDQTFFVDPNCSQNPLPAGCPAVTPQGAPAVFGVNFHTAHMPVVATGCTGPLSCESGQTLLGVPAVCDVGNGVCRTSAAQQTQTYPKQVHLDPTKRYYLTVLPGDAANPFNAGYTGAPDCSPAGVAAGNCGHGLGGAPIAKGQTSVMVLSQPSPYPPAKLTVFVFEDDYPLNGEHDAGGGVDVLSPQEPGLGGFEVTIFDDAGGTGDATGQPTYDMFNMPLTNGLAGTIDPITQLDACPISPVVTANAQQAGSPATPDQCAANPNLKGCQKGIIGMIVTCPQYESDGQTLSPLAGQAIVPNLYQGRYGIVATPGADRIARGEEWLQTNTLDGQKAHDSFMRIGEPAYFQEFGPAGYHVTIGFANPKIISDRGTNTAGTGLCDPAPMGGGIVCNNEVKGHITMARMSRPPDERLYGSGTRDAYNFTQCYASLGDPDGADFAFSKCDDAGNFDFPNVPVGNWKITIFDQWNDQIVDGIMQAVALPCPASVPAGTSCTAKGGGGAVFDFGEIAAHQWQSNIYTRTFLDSNGNGISDHDASGNDLEPGLPLVATQVRFRDGSFSNRNNTDLNGYAPFNEVFPLFSWYVIETDTTRFKTTGVHVVYDTGGPVDGSSPGGIACAGSAIDPCGSSTVGANLANTYEGTPLPANLSVPGAVYCVEGADCTSSAATYATGGRIQSSTSNHSSGRIDPPFWFGTYGWQGFSGQNNFLEFGKKPYVVGETGGIHGHVVYASTRPFDDPSLLVQNTWEPMVPHVRINLYKEGVLQDGVTPTLTLIDHTDTSSFDDWAQGFRADGLPNMNCPGQSTSDPFFFALQNQPNYLDFYNGTGKTLPYASQFKCYDGMHNWNQLQPAPYDGMYSFPSVTGFDPATGKPSGTNCTACTTNIDASDPFRYGGSTTPAPWVNGGSQGLPMLPAGKYVVEVVVPDGFELVKEEDKNILIGDNFIAPVTQQFGGLANIYILPDQAQVSAYYNANNPQNPTQTMGIVTTAGGDATPGGVTTMWPCVGTMRTVPDFISLFPGSAEVSPFAGAYRPLCDRKEVTLADQRSADAKFFIFTSAHAASHFTGVITDDFTSEFDPFSPQFGEKFAPAYLPVSIKDWTGNEISRVYSDSFGAYNGLSYSTWEVNPPNPTGYGPTMMVVCMNDAGAGTNAPWWDTSAGQGTSATPDPYFQPAYSQFCYELPFMPGSTGYFDTPVVPNSAFAEGYNHPDCAYPDATPAISTVNGDGIGPWVSASGKKLTITALGDEPVENYGYSGPSSTKVPFNERKVSRHYGFGTTAGTVALVGSDGVSRPLTGVSWGDGQITGNVPANVPNCVLQQQQQYSGAGVSTAQCGQLVITTAAGKTSVDTVTVTIGGKSPTRVPISAACPTIQCAIDAASPGDLIIVPKGVYKEMVLMWKPVRLQGVGAASAIIDANPHPAGRLDPWRRQLGCLFGLTPDGRPNAAASPANCAQGSSTQNYTATSATNYPTMIVDRVPTEGILGWDTTLNGNLAEQLIEPSLMGAYEGAAITVLAKGVFIPTGNGTDAWGIGSEAAFPTGTTLLDGTFNRTTGCGPNGVGSHNPYPSNFYCNPSSIDGLQLTNSSQGGGGIFVHAWAHHIQIANNRVISNTGTLSGGITIGQGEHVDLPLGGAANTPAAIPPGSCETSNVDNLGLPYCYNYRVNVHHNAVVQNSSMGDELFSSTPSGAGGVSIANGADYYQLTHNWICGNLSTGDGGGVAHVGWSKNGLIQHNAVLFNQSTNPTITTNGGGVLVMGAPDPDPPCGTNNDKDCLSPPSTIGPSDGTGLGLVIDANLIIGNSAESGSGGGLRLQHVNGTDVLNFPNGASSCNNSAAASCRWNTVQVTNNIIANNVAGWDGAGVSLLDALAVNIVNNTIISNDSTASSGDLFGSLFGPLASAPGTTCFTSTAGGGQQSCPQVAGLVVMPNTPVLVANLPTTGFSCPPNHGTAGNCRNFSVPVIANDLIWQNRSFYIGVGSLGSGQQSQQKLVSLFNASFTGGAGTAAASQSSTGQCPAGASYWDIGVRGDVGPQDHSSGLTLAPSYSFLSSTAGGYGSAGAHNSATPPGVTTQYCNGSRIPPEDVCKDALGNVIPCGWQVPPGTNETNALPTPVFSLTPNATVDEGNNWINMRWGPLSLTNPVTGATLGNFALTSATAPAVNYTPSTAGVAYTLAPASDFFGTVNRKANNAVDAGAIEFVASASHAATLTPSPLAFGNVAHGTASLLNLTVTNTGTAALNGFGVTGFGGAFTRITGGAFPPGAPNCTGAVAIGAACTIKVQFLPPATGSYSENITVTFQGATVTPTQLTITGNGT